MTRECPSLPLGLKTRLGFRNSTTEVIDVFRSFERRDGVAPPPLAYFAVHGRTQAARYSTDADHAAVREIAAAAASCASNGEAPPILANGDVLSYRDFADVKEATGCTTSMLARGVLYKPWLCREIKERRTSWDITSTERWRLYEDFCRFGLSHWGGDARGVATTRRYLLELHSFAHRYVPLGLLEEGSRPLKMQDRVADRFVGRDDLETALASTSVSDWIRLSERLLGPVEADFTFVPKHKANAWEVAV